MRGANSPGMAPAVVRDDARQARLRAHTRRDAAQVVRRRAESRATARDAVAQLVWKVDEGRRIVVGEKRDAAYTLARAPEKRESGAAGRPPP